MFLGTLQDSTAFVLAGLVEIPSDDTMWPKNSLVEQTEHTSISNQLSQDDLRLWKDWLPFLQMSFQTQLYHRDKPDMFRIAILWVPFPSDAQRLPEHCKVRKAYNWKFNQASPCSKGCFLSVVRLTATCQNQEHKSNVENHLAPLHWSREPSIFGSGYASYMQQCYIVEFAIIYTNSCCTILLFYTNYIWCPWATRWFYDISLKHVINLCVHFLLHVGRNESRYLLDRPIVSSVN